MFSTYMRCDKGHEWQSEGPCPYCRATVKISFGGTEIKRGDRFDITRLQSTFARYEKALEFYSKGHHFEFDDCVPSACEHQAEPETVSGEPTNYLCGHGDFTVENGAIAREALGRKDGS